MLAVGFTLIFGVARILNLAHGAFYALGSYSAYVFTTLLHFPLFIAAPLAVLFVAGFGVLMERFLVRPLRASQLAVLMITLSVSLAVEQGLFITFGSEYRNVPSFVAGKISIGGVDIGGQRLLALFVSVMVLCCLWLFIQRTRLGAAILAVSQDPEAAQYMGIPTNRIFSIVMAISAGTAALAGVLVSPFLTVQPGDGVAADGEGVCYRHCRRVGVDPRQHPGVAASRLFGNHRRLSYFIVVDRTCVAGRGGHDADD